MTIAAFSAGERGSLGEACRPWGYSRVRRRGGAQRRRHQWQRRIS